jgi:LysM repeat protein
METNESNLKPQPTGGLKLMTVFIAVLALHVVVIGGFTVWHLLYPSNLDADVAVDKHKGSKIVSDSSIADMQAPDSASTDKSTTPATDSSTDAAASTDVSTATTAPAAPAVPATPAAPATAAATPAPTPASTASAAPSTSDASAVITVPATPPTVVEDASSTAANSPAASVQRGPVINPPDNLAPPADASAPAAPAASSVATDATPAAAVDGTPYTVKHGDSLAKIAHRHHIALAKLRTANGLASDNLHIGQKLVIPSKTAHATADTVATTATTPAATAPSGPVADADSTETTTPATASAKPARESTAPMAQPVEDVDNVSTPAVATTHHTHHAATHHLYTVVKGDTLTKIARHYHTTTSAIMAANNISNAARLSIGEKLHIPSHESRAAAATASQEAVPEQPETHSAAKGQLANYVQ